MPVSVSERRRSGEVKRSQSYSAHQTMGVIEVTPFFSFYSLYPFIYAVSQRYVCGYVFLMNNLH